MKFVVGSEWVAVSGPSASVRTVRVLAVEIAFVLVEDTWGPVDEWGCHVRRWVSIGQLLAPATPALWCSIPERKQPL